MITVLGLRRPLGPPRRSCPGPWPVGQGRVAWTRHRLPRSGGLRRPAATGHASGDDRAC